MISVIVSFILGAISVYVFDIINTMLNPQTKNSNIKDGLYQESTKQTESTQSEGIIMQEDFNKWVLNISQIHIPNYEFESDLSNYGFSASAIDKELSFNKREVLTTSGKIEFEMDLATEKTIAFSNGTKIFSVAFMINDKNIGSNFQGSDWLYSTQSVYAIPLIMTYKNIIILTTLQDTKDYVDFVEAINLSKIIIENLN